jgi:hypothetical protein
MSTSTPRLPAIQKAQDYVSRIEANQLSHEDAVSEVRSELNQLTLVLRYLNIRDPASPAPVPVRAPVRAPVHKPVVAQEKIRCLGIKKDGFQCTRKRDDPYCESHEDQAPQVVQEAEEIEQD